MVDFDEGSDVFQMVKSFCLLTLFLVQVFGERVKILNNLVLQWIKEWKAKSYHSWKKDGLGMLVGILTKLTNGD